MKMKTSELTGFDLNKAVEKANNIGHPWRYYGQAFPNYCNEWKDGGPIIERERIELKGSAVNTSWSASPSIHSENWDWNISGPTPLIAAMRCYVASKLGDEVEI